MKRKLDLHPVSIDLSGVLQTTVASLYSHLVTRPTGRAVRVAIESQLAEIERTAMSLIDLSEVTVLDFSCADEVVAKLLQRFLAEDRPGEAFFVFMGVGEDHRHPIDEVLDRHALQAVVSDRDGIFELVGRSSQLQTEVWGILEANRSIAKVELDSVLPRPEQQEALAQLVRNRVAYGIEDGAGFHALSTVMEELRRGN